MLQSTTLKLFLALTHKLFSLVPCEPGVSLHVSAHKLLQELRIIYKRIFILVHKDKRRAPRIERRGVVISTSASCSGDHGDNKGLHTVNRHSKHHTTSI